MLARTVQVVILSAVSGLLAGWRQAAAAEGKYYIQLADTQEAAGVKSGLIEQAKQVLRAELAKRPEFVLASDDMPKDPDQLAAELKKRSLKGYKVFVRLTKVESEVLPPRQGRPFKQLSATVRADIVGVTLPGEVMALGGEGESSTATEISGQPKDAEVASLKKDALADALSQAVDKALAKLAQGFMKAPTDKPRKKK
jgi:hypothetical protein